jgi:hypothetical protein
MTIIKLTKQKHNISLAIWQLARFVETFIYGSAFILRMNRSAKNPPHRQQAKLKTMHITNFYFELSTLYSFP